MAGRLGIAMLAGAALFACSPASQAGVANPAQDDASASAASDQSAVHPVSGLQIIDLVVDSGDEAHRFRVELAASDEAQRRGLMFRTDLGPNEGMLFPSENGAEMRSFWMKNTPLSLDIIFIGTDGRVLNIAANTQPYTLESVRSTGLASAVLELRGGRAAELGIEPGDAVRYTLP